MKLHADDVVHCLFPGCPLHAYLKFVVPNVQLTLLRSHSQKINIIWPRILPNPKGRKDFKLGRNGLGEKRTWALPGTDNVRGQISEYTYFRAIVYLLFYLLLDKKYDSTASAIRIFCALP